MDMTYTIDMYMQKDMDMGTDMDIEYYWTGT
jgi:hypothetical protein